MPRGNNILSPWGHLKSWRSTSSLDEEDPCLLAKPAEDSSCSESLFDFEDDEDVADKRDSISSSSKITRSHWSKSRQHPTCSGCDKTFNLSRRKGHCRKCGQVFCQSCTRHKLPLNEKAEYDTKGEFHKVCYRCAREQEGVFVLGQTGSHSEDFRLERKQRRDTAVSDDEGYNTLPRHHTPEYYAKLLEKFKIDTQAPNNNNRLQASVQTALERMKLATRCASQGCKSGQLLLPQDRKLCVSCQEVFCRDCTGKDLVVFRPHDDPDCEPRVSVAMKVKVTSQQPQNTRTYRACDSCRKKVHHHCLTYYFHRDLELFQAEMMGLQAMISPALDRACSQYEGKVTHPPRSSSVADLLDIDSPQGQTEMAVDKRVLDKLFQQYFRLMNLLKTLQPTTSTQKKLHENVAWGTGEYYKTKRNLYRVGLGW